MIEAPTDRAVAMLEGIALVWFEVEGLVKDVPGRSYFCVVSSQNGDKFVASPPPPPQPLNGSLMQFKHSGQVDSLHFKPNERNAL